MDSYRSSQYCSYLRHRQIRRLPLRRTGAIPTQHLTKTQTGGEVEASTAAGATQAGKSQRHSELVTAVTVSSEMFRATDTAAVNCVQLLPTKLQRETDPDEKWRVNMGRPMQPPVGLVTECNRVATNSIRLYTTAMTIGFRRC